MGQIVTAPQRAMAGLTEPSVGRQFLVFSLADEVFAIDILRIREIIEFGHVTTVPLMLRIPAKLNSDSGPT